MENAVLLEHAPDLDRPRRRVAAVGVDEEGDVVPECRPHRFDESFSASGPLVLIVTADAADADLERLEGVPLTKSDETRGLLLRGDVASLARAVRSEARRLAAQELADALFLELPPEVPERRFESRESAEEMRAPKLVLELGDLVDDLLDRQRIAAESVRRDLAVEHLDGRIRVVRGHLTPPLGSFVGLHAHERDVSHSEGLDGCDPHAGSRTTTFRSVSPSVADAIASLISESGYRPVISSSSFSRPSSYMPTSRGMTSTRRPEPEPIL